MNADVDARFGSLEQQIVATRDEMNTRFEQVDARFDGVEARIVATQDEMNARFERIDARIRDEGAQTRAHFDMMYGRCSVKCSCSPSKPGP